MPRHSTILSLGRPLADRHRVLDAVAALALRRRVLRAAEEPPERRWCTSSFFSTPRACKKRLR